MDSKYAEYKTKLGEPDKITDRPVITIWTELSQSAWIGVVACISLLGAAVLTLVLMFVGSSPKAQFWVAFFPTVLLCAQSSFIFKTTPTPRREIGFYKNGFVISDIT